MNKYLIVIKNPHDDGREMKIPFDALNDINARILSKKILDIWYPKTVIKSLENENLVSLFELKPIQIDEV